MRIVRAEPEARTVTVAGACRRVRCELRGFGVVSIGGERRWVFGRRELVLNVAAGAEALELPVFGLLGGTVVRRPLPAARPLALPSIPVIRARVSGRLRGDLRAAIARLGAAALAPRIRRERLRPRS